MVLEYAYDYTIQTLAVLRFEIQRESTDELEAQKGTAQALIRFLDAVVETKEKLRTPSEQNSNTDQLLEELRTAKTSINTDIVEGLEKAKAVVNEYAEFDKKAYAALKSETRPVANKCKAILRRLQKRFGEVSSKTSHSVADLKSTPLDPKSLTLKHLVQLTPLSTAWKILGVFVTTVLAIALFSYKFGQRKATDIVGRTAIHQEEITLGVKAQTLTIEFDDALEEVPRVLVWTDQGRALVTSSVTKKNFTVLVPKNLSNAKSLKWVIDTSPVR